MSRFKPERRTTSWTFVCYPESMPEDWEQCMRDLHIPLAYILHDKDKENGKFLKPHVHVIVKYESVKSLEQVRQDFEFTGIQFFEQIRSFNAMTRYLCHLDDDDKRKYKPEDVIACSGLSLDFSRHLSPDEQIDVMMEITDYIEEANITQYADLWQHAIKYERLWVPILTGKGGIPITQFIKSRTYKQMSARK